MQQFCTGRERDAWPAVSLRFLYEFRSLCPLHRTWNQLMEFFLEALKLYISLAEAHHHMIEAL